ncbi:MAG: L-seryl-tRNA(Sec) selenium transferase, partial [Clostridiales bacterium]|nr:L-seryl-tRNA(Sec) selenium transferase [Clostridiales bacterium]
MRNLHRLAGLPNMNSLLKHPRLQGLFRERAKYAAQEFLDELRNSMLSDAATPLPGLDECAESIRLKAEGLATPQLRRLINATGVVLHTNLGRAPLGEAVAVAIADICNGYSNLEYDTETGERGDRGVYVERLLRRLTGAEAAMVVNNNAAAVFLMLGALAKGKRVALSRGEMVEIGGSFRVPEIMEQSGAELVEVGTTNRTRLSDYTAAIEEKGAEALLKVHTSNYEIVGFTESVSASALAALGKEKGLPVLYDMGACFMVEADFLKLGTNVSARSGIASGVDVLCFSGDKLLGSAQAGILAGRAPYIAAMKKHPTARMLRPDKLTLAALEASLSICLYPEEARRRIPVLAMLAANPAELRRRAAKLADRLRPLCAGWEVGIVETEDETGGGAMPNMPLPGWAATLRPATPGDLSLEELERRRRPGGGPVILRIRDGMAPPSLRTLPPGEEGELL